MKHKAHFGIMLAGLTVVLLLSGCGYQFGNIYPAGVRTVFVPVWTRGPEVYRREHEMELTEAVIKRIQMDTPYKIAPLDVADTKLTGQINVISQQVLTRDTDTGRAREREVTYTVSFTWTDLRTGEVLVKKNNFRANGRYISGQLTKGNSTIRINENFFEGSQEAVNEVAKRIVEQLQNEW